MIEIRRLNLDNSWAFTLGGRCLLVDPWLTGVEVDFFPWFNKQWHRHPPLDFAAIPAFDAVVITQKYPDHFHPETLSRLKPGRIIAPASLRRRLSKLLPEAEVHFPERADPVILLGGVTLEWFHSNRRIDPIYEAVALHDGEETVFMAAHGFEPTAEQLSRIGRLPPVRLLVSPVDEYRLPAFLGGSVAPGIKALERLLDQTGARHFVQTHDEEKHATGLVSRLARITRYSGERIRSHPVLGPRFLEIQDYEPHML